MLFVVSLACFRICKLCFFLICHLGSNKVFHKMSWALSMSYRTIPWAAKGESMSKTIWMQQCWVINCLQKAEKSTIQDVISSRHCSWFIDSAPLNVHMACKQHRPVILNVLSCMQADNALTVRTDFVRTSASAESSATSLRWAGHSNVMLLDFQVCRMTQKSKHEVLLVVNLSLHISV